MATFILRNNSIDGSVIQAGQLEYNTNKKTLVVGDGTTEITIAKMNVENQGSFLLTGDVKLSGSIYLGDVAADNIAALGTFTTNLVPNINNSIDIGTTSRYWKNVYATSISGAIAATNGVISGSSQITGILPAGTVSGSSQIIYSQISEIPLNIVSASTDTANVDITITNGNISADLKGGVVSSSAQIIDVISSLNQYTSSNDTRWNTLQNVTTSLNSFTSSQNTINLGYNSYTQSTNVRLNNLESTSGSVNVSITNLNQFTSSQLSQNSTLGTYTGSIETRFSTLATLTGSIATEQTNQNSRLTALEISSASVNSYTASLKTAIDVTGGNTTIKGNLIVQGSTTAVQSTTLNVADKNIVIASGSINSAASDGAGITIDGAGVSMSWSDGNQRIEFNKPLAILGAISASTITGLNNATVSEYSTSVDSRFVELSTRASKLEIATGSLNSFTSSQLTINLGYNSYTQSNDTINTTQNSRLTSLETASGSAIGRLNNLELKSASVDTSITNLNQFTSSQLSQNSTLSTYTGSVETRFTQIATVSGSLITSGSLVSQSVWSLHQFSSSQLTKNSTLATLTGSYDIRLNNLETTTGSLNTSVSNINISTSSLNSWSASVRINITNIHDFTASVNSKFNTLQNVTASLNSATASLYTSASQMTASLAQLRIDVDGLILTSDVAALGASVAAIKVATASLNLQSASFLAYTQSTNVRLDNLELNSASLNAWSSSLNSTFATDSELSTVSGAISTSIYLLSQSVDNRFTNLATYTGSNDTKWSTLGTQSGSWVTEAETASFVVNATSNLNVITFTKGNASTFNVTIDTGSQYSLPSGVVSGSSQLTSSYDSRYVTLEGTQTINGTKTFNNIVVNGTGSFARIESVSSQATIIGNSFVVVNTSTPTSRYAGITVYDSGSTLSTASFYFDGQLNDWNYEYSSSAGVDYAVALFGPSYAGKGSPTYPSSNKIQKGNGNHHLSDSNITDTGTLITLGSNSVVNGTFYATGTTLVSGSAQINGTAITNNTITIAGTSTALGGTITLATITGNSGIISGSGQLGSYETTGRGIVSGSSQITPLLPTGTVSGSSQVISILTSLNSYTASNDTTNNTQNVRLSNLEITSASVNISISNINTTTASLNTSVNSLNTASSSYETKGRGIVSGSSQIGNYVATITGTANQVVVAGSGNNAAAVTLSLPQSIATTSDVQFNNITASAGIRATGDIIAYYSSDERLKENIQPIQNALTKVELISGNTYDWKEGFDNIHPHKGNDVGVIAQEIEKVLPQVVIDRENGYKAVDYEKIIPLLIEAVKELSAKVKELENK